MSSIFLSSSFLVILISTVYGGNLTGNPTWDILFKKCWKESSFSCVQDGLHWTLETALDGDVNVTDSITFTKNKNKYTAVANQQLDNYVDEDFENFVNAVEDIDGNTRKSKSLERPKSVDSISDILYNKGVYYLMTHTLNMDLPETGFGGGRIKIEPRAIEEDGGVLIKLNFEERQQPSQGRLFFKKIKQIFKKKLMSSFLAAMLVIKMIKVKLMFLLPLIVGVTTAKKILLKVLLFLFPALTHLFKLCAFYHHHHTKWSHHLHHHHGVAHHHHAKPVYTHHHPEYLDYPPPGAEIIHRSEPANELSAWGIEYEEPKHESDSLNRVYTATQNPGVHVAHSNSYLTPRPQPIEDPFYSPILGRLDKVFSELGFQDEPCRERLVCSMYKAPLRFSPHSNLVSAEISRISMPNKNTQMQVSLPTWANPRGSFSSNSTANSSLLASSTPAVPKIVLFVLLIALFTCSMGVVLAFALNR